MQHLFLNKLRNIRKQHNKAPRNTNGFTLIEVMIIAPIVILAISGIVALMITMVGDAIATREENQLVFETQDALNRIEEDTRLTSQFLANSLTLPSPQGSNNDFTGTQPFTSDNSLIIGGLTTDRNPVDPARALVFYANQPNGCSSDLLTYNRIFQQKIVYYLRDNSLWRRAIVPDYNTSATVNDSTVCATPWQRNTCRPGATATRCATNDSEVMRNVDTFEVDYLENADSMSDVGPENADSAEAIRVTLTGRKEVKGRDVISSGSIVGSKVNNVNVDPPAPSIPVITSDSVSNNVTFSWQAVPNATSYVIEYRINGGAVTTRTVNNQTLTQAVTGTNRQDTVSIQVKARNSTDESIWGTASYTIPDFYPCQLQNGWVNYGHSFSTAGFTRTSAGLVKMKGLIRSGNTALGTTICTLPEGFRPTGRLIFSATNNGTHTRIDILPSGEILIWTNHTDGGFLSLDEIQFIAQGSGYSWTNVTFQNGWYNYNAGYAPVQRTTDSAGRTQLQGLAGQGNFNGCNTVIASNVPSAPAWAMWPSFAANSELNNGQFNQIYTNTSGQVLSSCTNPQGWHSLQGTYYAGSSSGDGWKNIPLTNGWTRYSTTYVDGQYTRGNDGLVSLRGLIRSGCANNIYCNLGTLPNGYRPKERLIFTGIGTDAYARINVLPNGNMFAENVTSNQWLSLDNISFMAETRDANRNITNGMVGFYRMNGNAQDSSGYGYNGSIVGSNSPTSGQGSASNTAMYFNGSTYINLGNPGAWPSGTSPKTVCTWARTNNTSGYRWVFSYGNPSYNNAFFIGQNGTTMQAGGGFGPDDITLAGGWGAGVWAHTCNVYYGNSARMYLNSIDAGIRSPMTWNLIKNRAYIGRQVNNAENWIGDIDEVRVYNRALTADEINNLYLYGSD